MKIKTIAPCRFIHISTVLALVSSLLTFLAAPANAVPPCYVLVGTVLTDGSGCSGEVVIEEGVTGITERPDGYGAFENNSLTSVSIPASVTNIGRKAFNNATSLTSVTFAPGSLLSTIGDFAFGITPNLKSFTVPSQVTLISTVAFSQSLRSNRPCNANGNAGIAYLIFEGTAPVVASGYCGGAAFLNGVYGGAIAWVRSEHAASFQSPNPQILGIIQVLQAGVTSPPPTIFSPQNGDVRYGQVGISFSETISAIGVGNLTYTVSIGSLPSGLTLNPNGNISGTPTTSGLMNLTLTVTDSVEGTQSVNVAFDIAPRALPDIFFPEPGEELTGQVGIPTRKSVSFDVSGEEPGIVSISSGSLPPGISMDNAGLITGTPTTAGTYTFTVRVDDSFDQFATSDDVIFEIAQAFAQPITLTASLPIMAATEFEAEDQFSLITTNAPSDFKMCAFFRDSIVQEGGYSKYNCSLVQYNSFLDEGLRSSIGYEVEIENSTWTFRIYGPDFSNNQINIDSPYVATTTVKIFNQTGPVFYATTPTFSATPVGSTDTQIVTVYNLGNAPLVINYYVPGDESAQQFDNGVIEEGDCALLNVNIPLAPQETCTIKVVFRPTEIGTVSTNMYWSFQNGNNPWSVNNDSYGDYATIPISGIGTSGESEEPIICDGVTVACSVGDIGPGGGEIFYYSQTPFACGPTLAKTCNYLELAPTAGPEGFEIGGNDWTDATKQSVAIGEGARGTAIGTGYKNSLAMVAQWGEIYHAATTTRGFRGPNNKDDWYLGSRDEVALIHSYFQDSISDYPLWTSTEFSAKEAIAILADGNAVPRNKDEFPIIWPIRAFSAGNQVSCGTSGYFVVSSNEVTSHYNCAGSVVIPNGVIDIGDNAFASASGITSVSIPNSVETIGFNAFNSLTSLTSLTIGNGALTIGVNAFSGASLLTTVIIPEGVRFIGAYAFEEDESIETLSIPSTIESIGAGAFDGTTALRSFRYCGTRLGRQDLENAGLDYSKILPCVSAPTAPTSIVALTTGKRSAKVTITSTASNGGSSITSYTITASPGGLIKSLPVSGSVTSLVYEFTNLQPGTKYTFSVTATNAVGTSSATSSNEITTVSLVVASITTLTYNDDGTGSAGKLVWTGKNIESVLFTGPINSYPGPFNYGAFTSGWNGTIRNLTPETSYTISLSVVSEDGLGESKNLTFTTGVKIELVKDLAYWNTWLRANTFMPNEADNLIGLLNKFNAIVTSPYRSYIKVPISRVSTVTAISLTPKSCSVVSASAKADAGLVQALTKETCTISYTVSGASKAPATLVKDFHFKKIG